jgi:iron complex transport system ATP-binding protein
MDFCIVTVKVLNSYDTEEKISMSERTYFFRTEKLTVGYDKKPLIRAIEMKVNRGQILTLIGPNGSGKSTILKSITRQLQTIGGTVYLDSQPLKQISNHELSRRLAVVLTERIQGELMTCEDIVATGRYPYTGRLGILSEEDRQKVCAAMEQVHALDLRDRDFRAISDGQRQRILLARAICQEPEIIVLDEPTSFLDIRHKLELLSILKQMVSEKQVAVIMSLHELDLAQKVSDYVMCVSGEYIRMAGTPEEVFTSEYIRELYGMTDGSYNAKFGCVELPAISGDAEVFVIAGGGSGISTFRRLQRQGIPFAAGVLHENDIDYEVARTLAVCVIREQAYEPIRPETLEKAREQMLRCKKVICCLDRFGTMNAGNRELLLEAKKRGLLCDAE